MKDDLQAIIHSLSSLEQKEFRQFIQRNRFKNSRIDLDLFDLFVEERDIDNGEVLLKLYGDDQQKNAYHSVRKRLIKHINEFIYLRQIDSDESLDAEISKNLILVRHLFAHNLTKLAWKNLKKSERLAEQAELNVQLQLIYDLQIEHFDTAYVQSSLDDLVKKRMQIALLADDDQKLKIVGSFVKQELAKVKIQAVDLDLERILDLLLNTFEMNDTLFRRPKLRYNFMLIARGIILANKAFYSFEEYAIQNYDKINASGYFEAKPSYRLNILYIIAHTLYRNKKFDKAIEYLQEMETTLTQVNKGVFNRFNPKYHLLLAACENFNGSIENAIEILETLNTFKSIGKEDELNARLNLSIYHFQNNDFKTANRTLQLMGKTDHWLDKNIGVEWRVKKNLIEIIYQYELGNYEIAFDRILAMERSQKDLLVTEKYRRISVFLNLLKFMIDHPNDITSEAFYNKVETSIDWIEKEKEDLQAMGYYAWLKAKMSSANFYDVMLGLIKV
ncbi:hypothetical protein [Crocinitomix catalasitica]|uniref:hypothetical protein n=1 Tax=Crocinitomix catalasitica TaxID=184607 RepID=UPI000482D671|nr:hypothetical protein [Crocinitomix catalasitica]